MGVRIRCSKLGCHHRNFLRRLQTDRVSLQMVLRGICQERRKILEEIGRLANYGDVNFVEAKLAFIDSDTVTSPRNLELRYDLGEFVSKIWLMSGREFTSGQMYQYFSVTMAYLRSTKAKEIFWGRSLFLRLSTDCFTESVFEKYILISKKFGYVIWLVQENDCVKQFLATVHLFQTQRKDNISVLRVWMVFWHKKNSSIERGCFVILSQTRRFSHTSFCQTIWCGMIIHDFCRSSIFF